MIAKIFVIAHFHFFSKNERAKKMKNNFFDSPPNGPKNKSATDRIKCPNGIPFSLIISFLFVIMRFHARRLSYIIYFVQSQIIVLLLFRFQVVLRIQNFIFICDWQILSFFFKKIIILFSQKVRLRTTTEA